MGLFLINTVVVVVVALISLFLKRQRHHHTNSKRSFGKRNEVCNVPITDNFCNKLFFFYFRNL